MTRLTRLRMRCAQPALAALLLGVPVAASAQDADLLAAQQTRSELELRLGASPVRCVADGAGLELCEWQLGNRDGAWKALARSIGTDSRISVLCELPADGGARARGSCTVHPRRSDDRPWSVPNRPATKGGGASASERRAQREELARRAAAALAQARTLREISRLVGAAPDQCVSPQPGVLACLWRATSRTQGHALLAATIEAPQRKKLRLECRVPADGTARAPDSCRVEIGT